jgi:hypothetical protein
MNSRPTFPDVYRTNSQCAFYIFEECVVVFSLNHVEAMQFCIHPYRRPIAHIDSGGYATKGDEGNETQEKSSSHDPAAIVRTIALRASRA